MNFSLLDSILESERAILATVLTTTGHTYKKAGEKALFVLGNPFPVSGNLGSLCAEQDIVRGGQEAHDAGRPRIITVDTSTPDDIHFGYGAYCGGTMEILLEPLSDSHRAVYRDVRLLREKNKPIRLLHNIQTGDLLIADTDNLDGQAPHETAGPDTFVEDVAASPEFFVFGATPLAEAIVTYIGDLDFVPYVIDWRTAYLDRFAGIPRVRTLLAEYPFDRSSFVLVASHNYEQDRAVLKVALTSQARYIGLLSSQKRREAMYEELAAEGMPKKQLMAIHSPAGVAINGKSDPEIAVSIVAEMIAVKNT